MVTVSHKKLRHPQVYAQLTIDHDVPLPDKGHPVKKRTKLSMEERIKVRTAMEQNYQHVIPQSKYRLHEMEPGDSVFIPTTTLTATQYKGKRGFPTDPLQALANRVAVAITRYNTTFPTMHFIKRTVTERDIPGVRVWRVE